MGKYSDMARDYESSLMQDIKKSYQQELRRPKATDDMTGGEKFLAGIGQGMMQIPRGIGQLSGIYNQSQIDEMKRLDADLMATPQGGLGSFAGQTAVGAAMPLKVPMITNPIANRAVVGGLFGAAQPTATGESRASNVAMGAAAGVALPPMITATGKTIANTSSKIAPKLTQSLSQGVSRGINAVNNAKSSAIAKYPVLGTEVDPAAIVSSLRSSQQLTAPLDLQNAMPNPQNPQAIQAAKEGAEAIGFKWDELNIELQRRLAANADEAIRLGSDLTPQQLARKTMLEAQGFIPTKAHVTGASEDFTLQNSLMLHPEGAKLREAEILNNENLKNKILGLGTQEKALPTPQYGEVIRKGLGAEKAIAENRTGNLYRAAAENEGAITTNADELANILKDPASFAVTKIDSPLRQYIKAIGKDDVFWPKKGGGNKPKELTMQELATLRQIVNSKWENADNATQAQLSSIRGILDKMEANPNDAAFLYNKARISRIVQGKKWEQPLIDKVFAQDKNYQGVYRLDNKDLLDATIKNTSIEEFSPLWLRMNKQQKDLTRSQIAKDMQEKTFSNMQMNAGEVRLEQASPAKLIKYIDDIGYDKIKLIYGKEQADKLMLLQRTWKELSSSPQGTKSFGSAPELARLHRMTLNLLSDFGGRLPLVGRYVSKGAQGAEQFAKQQAEAANRALNTNRALDVNFDARVRTLGALDALAKQRVIEAKANKDRGFIPSSQSGVFTLQSYIDSLQKQQNEDKR